MTASLEILEAESRFRAEDLDYINLKLKWNRDVRLGHAAELMKRSKQGTLSDDNFRLFTRAVNDATLYHDQLTKLESLRRQSEGMAALIRSEPRVYGPANPQNSWWRDVAAYNTPDHPDRDAATARLERYSKELAVEARQCSPEGRRARRLWAEAYRTDDPVVSRRNAEDIEVRALSSGAASAGAFVSPVWLTEHWAAYRSPDRSFADQCTLLPLPPYGLQVDVPSFTSLTSTAQQTENSGVAEADPTGAAIQATLVPIAGQVYFSQQLFDRGGASGLAFDAILTQQLKVQLDSALDLYVINQAIANAGTVTDTTSLTWPLLLADVDKAREQLADTVGTRLLATHLVTTSDFFGWATKQVDGQQRPILTPDSGAIVSAQATGDPKWNSWSGVHLGALRWHLDDNIPAASGNAQLLVARPQEVFVFDGEVLPFAYPESGATTLSVLAGLRAYVGAVVRYPKAIAVVSGSSYSGLS